MYDDDPDVFRGVPPPVPRVRAISSTDRLLKPTKASLAASRNKVLTGKEKERAEALEVKRRRRRLARVAKENGPLTIARSPKFHVTNNAAPRSRSRADMLTRTSRELLEIAAIRKRVEEQKRKTERYREAINGAAERRGDQFSKSFSASGGVGVPAVRRPKLTSPVGFELEIDKRAEARQNSLKRKSATMLEDEVVPAQVVHDEQTACEKLKKRRMSGRVVLDGN